MTQTAPSERFFDDLPVFHRFEDLSDPARFSELPEDWLIGTSDIVNSTGEIAAGRYKTVNMVGAAVISAVMNALDGRKFPFVFGGDGASFAVWPDAEGEARAALAAVRRWAEEEFGISLHTALVPAGEVEAAGRPALVARYGASQNTDYAMFAGGGVSWAEAQMKAGANAVAPAAPGTSPDLTGLACRWAHMKARNGLILSLVVLPEDGADPQKFRQAIGRLTEITGHLDRNGHPAPEQGPDARWPTQGAAIEVKARRREGGRFKVRLKVILESVIAMVFLRLRIKAGGFDTNHYIKAVVANADFRKFDDGLKMTIDCDAATRDALVATLDEARDAGLLRYGTSEQSEAMMTCIVPAPSQDDHVHFIDGAAGGYALAAAQLKAAPSQA